MTDTMHWVGTWTAAPAPGEGAAFSNHTLRMIPRVSLGGSTVRIRISNAYGTRPLAIGAARVGVRSTGPAVVAGSNRRITFGGEPSATIAAGALIVSDPVRLELAPLSGETSDCRAVRGTFRAGSESSWSPVASRGRPKLISWFAAFCS